MDHATGTSCFTGLLQDNTRSSVKSHGKKTIFHPVAASLGVSLIHGTPLMSTSSPKDSLQGRHVLSFNLLAFAKDMIDCFDIKQANLVVRNTKVTESLGLYLKKYSKWQEILKSTALL